eukprot:TRINITY_DN2411_c0_g1_i1.p1 TRINITY_DN2411_c0_g1~~TRINITY_DN2411_c0_g1_i1.p1  ORF type:complete len:716 (-),score=167.89 TRINITY_DN2411_c0_g1_i1:76-2223(-)
MSNNRKLQGEIDRLMKKVQEGVIEFDAILSKVYAASSSNQKEKYEADLKKEIKKLQRSRDQIKTWIASSEVKQKTQLQDARKTIESKMEQFKTCEKDSKTKAFSKEGLSMAATDDDGKGEVRAWIGKCLKELQNQIDTFEAEIETVPIKKRATTARVDELNVKIGRHKFHLEKLEKVLRNLENDSITVDQTNEIKDTVEYYVDSNSDPEFIEDDAVYDALPLVDEDDKSLLIRVSGDGQDDDSVISSDDDSDRLSQDSEASENSVTSTSTTSSSGPAAKLVVPAPKKVEPPPVKAPIQILTNAKPAPVKAAPEPTPVQRKMSGGATTLPPPQTAAQVAQRAATKGATAPAAAPTKGAAQTTPPEAPFDRAHPSVAYNQFVRNAPGQPAPATTPAQPHPLPQPYSMAAMLQRSNQNAQNISSSGAQVAPVVPATTPATTTTTPGPSPSPSPAPQVPSPQPTPSPPPAQVQVTPAAVQPPVPTPVQTPPPQTEYVAAPEPLKTPKFPTAPQQFSHAGASNQEGSLDAKERESALNPQNAAPSPDHHDYKGAENFDAASDFNLASLIDMSSATQPDTISAMSLLEASMKNIPDPVDSERPKQYVPRNPWPSPNYYPQNPLSIFDNPATFEKFDTDTLFFIFYYQQGSYQQYLAAKELKKQSWRYHKKYLTWFQRHEEPKEITNDYEQGTYVYFDYETGWCQRKKTEFTFEYRYLEDYD